MRRWMRTLTRGTARPAVFTAAVVILAAGMIAACFLAPSLKADAARKKLTSAKVVLARKTYTYTGKRIKPKVRYKSAGRTVTLRAGRDYTMTYSARKQPGTATVTIRGKGRYKGTVRKTFKIIPSVRKIYRVAATDEGYTVKWVRAKADATAYQLQYSTSKTFADNVGSYYKRTDSGTAKFLVAIFRNVKPNERYYVRMRKYRVSKGAKYFSKWSPVVSVRTKNIPTEDPDWQGEAKAFTGGRLFYTDVSYNNVQGLCTNRRNAVYVALREGGNTAYYDRRPTMLRKIDLKGNVKVSNKSTCYCHANAMTYNPKDGNLYIATLGRAENQTSGSGSVSAQDFNVIGVADGKTLKNKGFFSIQEEMKKCGTGPVWLRGDNTPLECPCISTVYYDETTDRYLCTVKHYTLEEGGRSVYQAVAAFDAQWQLVDYVSWPCPGVYSGNFISDGTYYYLVANKWYTKRKLMTVLDHDFNVVGEEVLPAIRENELECADLIGDTLYASFNTKTISIQAFDFNPGKYD